MNIFLNSLKFISKDIIGNILYFPVWWYTAGAVAILKKIFNEAKSFGHDLNLGILFKYLFKPMYGLTDVWSRIISFIVRIAQFIILSFITFIWLFFLFILFLLWLLIPIFIGYQVLYQWHIFNWQLI